MNTKGSVKDVLLIGILLLAVGFTFFVGNYIGHTINTQLLQVSSINASARTEILSVNNALDKFDYIILGLYIGLFLSLIITAWFVSAYPVFMWIYFFILIFIIALSTIFSQIWTALVDSAVWVGTLSLFPITNNILSNLPVHLTVMGLVSLLVLFGKPFFKSDFG